MLNALAQAASQPAYPPPSWRSWDAATWLFVIGGVVSILVAAWAKIQSANAKAAAERAQVVADRSDAKSTQATAVASAAKAVGDVNSERIGNVSRKTDLQQVATTAQLNALSLAVTPPSPTPSVESIARAMDATDAPQTPPPPTPENPQ